MGKPPPIIRAMPERKRFFSVDPFPKANKKIRFIFLIKTLKKKFINNSCTSLSSPTTLKMVAKIKRNNAQVPLIGYLVYSGCLSYSRYLSYSTTSLSATFRHQSGMLLSQSPLLLSCHGNLI